MDCRTARRDLSARMDGELAPERLDPLDAHLRGCPDCARAARAMAGVREWFGALPRPAAPAGVASAALARIRGAGARVRPALPFLRAASAAAAALLVATGGAILLAPSRPASAPLSFTADATVDRILDHVVRDTTPPLVNAEDDR